MRFTLPYHNKPQPTAPGHAQYQCYRYLGGSTDQAVIDVNIRRISTVIVGRKRP